MIKTKTRRVAFIISVVITLITLLNSCYYREMQYSFDRSSGGVYADTSLYYLGQIKEFRRPKGISRFPDGGRIKVVRKVFGLFMTDTLSYKTEMAARLMNVKSWPSGYKSRIEKNGTEIIIGIANISFPDSVNGIYLYKIKSGELIKYSGEGVLPAISETGTLLAYCTDTVLYIENYSDRSPAAGYHLDAEPVYVTWEDKNTILLFYSDPFRVMKLDMRTGSVTESDLDYIPNYDQELNATEIRKIVEKSSPDLKNILDNS